MTRQRVTHWGYDADFGLGVRSVIACCSKWMPRAVQWTPDPADVTCNNCRRTVAWKLKVEGKSVAQ